MDPRASCTPPEPLDFRLLSIYPQLYRIEAGAWYKNHRDWMMKIVHPGCFAGLPEREAMEASWDTQMDLATATEEGDDMLLAFLDYYKFFDSFHPPFIGEVLKATGVQEDLVDMFVHLNVNTTRHIKINGTFGPPMKPYNALGQGDPLVLLAAIIYVSHQLHVIGKRVPQVKGAAVLDDRGLRGPPECVDKAVRIIRGFDDRAGHITNLGKSTFAASTKKAQHEAEGFAYDGHKPRMVSSQGVVGDVITTLSCGAAQLPNKRLDFALRGAARVSRAPAAMKAKLEVLQTATIPRILPSTLWTRPSAVRLRKLRTQIVTAAVGKGRTSRAPELVTNLVLNPARADPEGAILAKTLMDTRRLLRRS